MAGSMQDKPGSQPRRNEQPSDPGNDVKNAAYILDARKKAMDEIVAGRPAPYFLASAPPQTDRPQPVKDARIGSGPDARVGIGRHLANALSIIAFLVVCAFFIREVTRASQAQAHAKSTVDKAEIWVCPILGKCGPPETTGLGRW